MTESTDTSYSEVNTRRIAAQETPWSPGIRAMRPRPDDTKTEFETMRRGEAFVREIIGDDRSADVDGLTLRRNTVRVGNGSLAGRPGTAGVDPLANLSQPEGKDIPGQAQMQVQMTAEEWERGAGRWHTATARHRPDPNHPANQREV
jgi:hypothetical protein